MIRSLPLQYPTLPTQRKIAAILSAYDDLIENNTRRIAILEDMAHLLYREWFVHFRFPGHETVKLVDSPLGKMPEGWEVRTYSELLRSYLGGGWGSEETTTKEDCETVVVRGTDFRDIMSGTTIRAPRRYISASSFEVRRLKEGDLIVENSVNAKTRCVGSNLRVTPGVLKRLEGKAIAASFCKVFRFKIPPIATLAHLHMKYLHESGEMAFFQNVAANGIGNFQAKRFVETECLIIPKNQELLTHMLEFLNLLTSSTYSDQIFNLRTTRDLLLPKLISGEIDVSELEIQVPEVESAA